MRFKAYYASKRDEQVNMGTIVHEARASVERRFNPQAGASAGGVPPPDPLILLGGVGTPHTAKGLRPLATPFLQLLLCTLRSAHFARSAPSAQRKAARPIGATGDIILIAPPPLKGGGN